MIALSGEEAAELLGKSDELLDACFGESTDQETLEIYHEFQRYSRGVEAALSKINLGTERINAINTAIRNQSRNDAARTNENLKSIVDECIVIVGSRIKHIEVGVRVSPSLQLEVVRSQFGQVLMNLLANAADAVDDQDYGAASRSEARILIAAKQTKDRFELSIEDSGPGIPEELRQKILQPFFTTKDVGKGTGLGMPIVLRILETHGFELSISQSASLGGAKFSILTKLEETEGVTEVPTMGPKISSQEGLHA